MRRPYDTREKETDEVGAAFATEFLLRYLDGWNAHAPDRLLDLCHQDIWWEDPTIPGGLAVGKASAREWLEGFFAAFSELRFDFLQEGPDSCATSLGGRILVAPWTCEGRWTGTLRPTGLSPNGRCFRTTGVDLYSFKEGRLTHVRTITDTLDVLEQLGVVPSRDGRLLKGIAVLQRLAGTVRRPSALRKRTK
ncbi:MAG: ester cyclase [Myxococcales bacterium]|nr:ester cyclase [Myxococcales bacterium]